MEIRANSEKQVEETKDGMRLKRENEEIKRAKKARIEAILEEKEKKEEKHLSKKVHSIRQKTMY